MKTALVLPLAFGVAFAQEFVPDTTGLDGAIGVVMAVVVTLATVGIVIGVIGFIAQAWIHRGG